MNNDDDKNVDEDVEVEKVRMTMRRTTRRVRRTKRRRTMTIAKLSSVLPFWNHQLKPN